MKNLLTLILMAACLTAFAQQDTTTVYVNPGYNKDPLRSKWIPKVEKQDSLWSLSLYNKKKVLQEKISYVDEKLQVRKGPYAFYEDGVLQKEGFYDKGHKHGEWKVYSPEGKLEQITTYALDVLNGPEKMYWDNGKLKQEGQYIKGKMVGEWKAYYKNGQLAMFETFDDNGKSVSRGYLDQNGNAINFLVRKQQPIYPGGMQAFYQYVSSELVYPPKAAKNNVKGVVKLQFAVLTDGSIAQIEVKESPDFELSQEAIRVLRNCGKWIPGKELGEPAKMYFSLPINFALN